MVHNHWTDWCDTRAGTEGKPRTHSNVAVLILRRAQDAARYRFAPWLLHKPPASPLDRF